MKLKKYFAILTSIILIVIVCFPVSAAEDNRMPEIIDTPKSLTVHFYVQKTGIDIPISGAEIGIFKVAELNCNGGSADYILLPQYESLKKTDNGKDTTFDGISVSEAAKLSEKLAALTDTPQQTGITDVFGNYKFENLSQGMYLVKELNVQGMAADYEKFSPYIISVPLALKSPDGNSWKYDIISEPKTEIQIVGTDTDGSDTDKSTDTSSDISSDTDSNTNSNTASNNDSDKKTTVTSGNPTSPHTGDTSSGGLFQMFDVTNVKTGMGTNIVILMIILFGSVFFVALTANSAKEDSENEEN